jgi:hypothetical protein
MATKCTLPDNTAPNYFYPNNTLTTTLCQTLAKGETLCGHTIPRFCWRFHRFSALFLPSEAHGRTTRQPVLAREAASTCPSRAALFASDATPNRCSGRCTTRRWPALSSRLWIRGEREQAPSSTHDGVLRAEEKEKPRPEERATRQVRGSEHDGPKPHETSRPHLELSRRGVLAFQCSTVSCSPWASYP